MSEVSQIENILHALCCTMIQWCMKYIDKRSISWVKIHNQLHSPQECSARYLLFFSSPQISSLHLIAFTRDEVNYDRATLYMAFSMLIEIVRDRAEGDIRSHKVTGYPRKLRVDLRVVTSHKWRRKSFSFERERKFGSRAANFTRYPSRRRLHFRA